MAASIKPNMNLLLIIFAFVCMAQGVNKLNEQTCPELPQPLNLMVASVKSYKHFVNPTRHSHSAKWKNFALLALILSNDVQLNPGPTNKSVFPCGCCERPVTWEHRRALCCDNCSVWYHTGCIESIVSDISLLQRSHVSWYCCKCDSQCVNNFTYHSYEFETHNRFETLSSRQTLSSISSDISIPSVDSSFSPKVISSPKPRPHSDSILKFNDSDGSVNFSTQFANKNSNNFRVLSMNCQSIRNKKTQLAESVEYMKPDVIIACETWLDSTHSNAEIFPEGFRQNILRKDRNANGGGVLIAFHDKFNISTVENSENDCELQWAEVQTRTKSAIIGAYYRPPDNSIKPLDDLKTSISNISEKNKDKPMILAGDFNLPNINWETNTHIPGKGQLELNEELLSISNDFNLDQLVKEDPTRENNILDLIFTNRPNTMKSCNVVPGVSDHEMVVADFELKPRYNKPKRREIPQYRKANWESIKSYIKSKGKSITESTGSVEKKWNDFKQIVNETVNVNVPKKLSSKRFNLPWLGKTEKKLIVKRNKQYQRARQTMNESDWEKYKMLKRNTQKAVRQAHWNYVNSILNVSLEEGNSKPFWNYVKSKRNDNIGVSGLKKDGVLHQESKDKANILNSQFKSVFTKENPSEKMPNMNTEHEYPPIGDIRIDPAGAEKLLKNLNVNKACGPDQISNTFLKECAQELSPILSHIYQLSLDSGELPSDWRNANVSPIFKKGDRHTASNYRPVSLTCVCCKLLEHIICRHILNHLEKYNILTELQHGFRSGHSCESQLIITMNDIMKNFDSKIQTDMAILDFSKAFDTVPHRKLLHKLDNYGIRGNINKWIGSFLMDRKQQVIVEGETSEACTVDSGVPQGTVLGPLLFLCHINDLPSRVKSQVRLFADDCLLYRKIRSLKDQLQLQEDLKALEKWAEEWGMRFNATKCYIMSIHRNQNPFTHFYELNNHILSQVNDNPYLGVMISANMKWSTHIEKIYKKANSTLGFIRRNLKNCNIRFKETAYISLVRSVLDYSSTVWDPFLQKDIDRLESVQRSAARFVKSDYRRTSSVSGMMEELGWKPLHQRRKELRLTLLFKIVNDLVAIPAHDHITFNQRPQRNKHQRQINILPANTDIYKHSFFPRTIKDWNSLPESAITCGTINTFKETIQKLD